MNLFLMAAIVLAAAAVSVAVMLVVRRSIPTKDASIDLPPRPPMPEAGCVARTSPAMRGLRIPSPASVLSRAGLSRVIRSAG